MSIFKVQTEDNKIVVKGEVLPYRTHGGIVVKRESVETSDIEKYLEEQNIEFGECIESSSLNNRKSDSLSGIWVFEKKKLDKPAEYVILPIEEEKTAPKKRQSRKKKKTNK